MKKELVVQVNNYLANIGVSYIKLHNLHWNVVGMQFKAVHEYLESIYDEFADILDEVAEILKRNDEMPLASMKDYVKVATIQELDNVDIDVKSAMQIVIDDMKALKVQALAIRAQADEEDQFDVANHMEDDVEKYNKIIWFVQSMLK